MPLTTDKSNPARPAFCAVTASAKSSGAAPALVSPQPREPFGPVPSAHGPACRSVHGDRPSLARAPRWRLPGKTSPRGMSLMLRPPAWTALQGARVAVTSYLLNICASTKGIKRHSVDLVPDLHCVHILEEHLVNAGTIDRIDDYIGRSVGHK